MSSAMWFFVLNIWTMMFVYNHPVASKTLQTAAKISDGGLLIDIPQPSYVNVQTSEGDSEDMYVRLWTNIEAAFRFLEQHSVETDVRRNVQEYMQQAKTLDKTGKLAHVRHHFIRFGKRFVPSDKQVTGR